MNEHSGPSESSEFDFIVVGSGAGGGPLAARLALAGHRVLVIEAGGDVTSAEPSPEGEVSLVPSLHAVSTEHPELSWRFFVKHYATPPAGKDPKWHDPDPGAGEDQTHAGIFYPRAAAVGGCTVHNAMITIAGPDSDWDDLADLLDDPSWRAARMQQYFRRLEFNEYHKAPKCFPVSWWGQARDALKWLVGRDPDNTRGQHGFDGWLHTSVADLSLGLTDKQLIKMLKAALVEAQRAGLERADTLVSTFLRGKIGPALDPNHKVTKAESPEGLVLIPIAVCGNRTNLVYDKSKPNVDRGRRSSPRELLQQVQKDRPENLVIWTDCLVTKILFDENNPVRAVGVQLLRGKRLYRAHPRPNSNSGEEASVFVRDGGEVILCGGAFNTPQLLMLSGVGDVADLEEMSSRSGATSVGKNAGRSDASCCLHGRGGQPLFDAEGKALRIHSPGVGKNLQDRYEVTVISEMQQEFSLLRGARFRGAETPDGGDEHLLEWREFGTGLYSSNGAVLGIFKRSKPELSQPDLFIFGVPLPFRGYAVNYSAVGDEHNYFTWTILKGHTQNHDGTVVLRTADPRDTPEINFHYFNTGSRPDGSASDPDLDALVHGVQFVRGIARNEVARFVVKREAHPGAENVSPNSETQVRDWIRREAWGHHACGTCRMGRTSDPNSVLDSRFRVLGAPDHSGMRQPVRGLRIVDASIFPRIPGYFIVANLYMASEKAADVILEDTASARNTIPRYPAELQRREATAIRERRAQAATSDSSWTPVSDASGPWPDDVTALGISGGGIRSATLALGVLQSMAASRWLRRIDLMSTVSGGGYIGSCLGRWFDRLRHPPAVDAEGRIPVPAAPDVIERELADSNSPTVSWLRKHGNYIAPTGDGDWRLNSATYIRNFLSVHLVVGLLVFSLFGLANAIRFGLFEPVSAGLGFLQFGKEDLPIGYLLDRLLGRLASPWFIVFELLLLFLVLPRMIGYWIVSQDKHERFHPVSLALLFVVGGTLLLLGVDGGLTPQPLALGIALFSAFLPVELAWRRGRASEAALGSGGAEVQRLRTRNILTYDLGLVLTLAGAAGVFACVDSIGFGLQQWLVERNGSYAIAFAQFGAMLMGLIPIVRFLAGLFTGGKKRGGPPSTMSRIFKQQLVAGVLAVTMISLPLIFVSFTAHAAFQGGHRLLMGLEATAFALVLSLIIRHPRAITFVNRSSLAQTYSARLARAYLGASNPLRHRPEGADVTEVVAGDDIGSIRNYKPHSTGGPFHLLNLIVNQTIEFTSQRGSRDRKGENFAVSCLGVSVGKDWHSLWADPPAMDRGTASSGNMQRLQPVGYFPGDDHAFVDEAGEPTNRAEMLSLRQWMALSGAAMGPGTGQSTRLGTSLLMGLANIRTGYWWNSGLPAAARSGYPKLIFLRRLLYLVPEFFWTQAMILYEWTAQFAGPWEQYWNLSDGGFFENTAGYELIRRRIPRIVICDGSADPNYHFESLGNLISKVRIDFSANVIPFSAAELTQHVPTGLLPFVGTLDDLQPIRDGDGVPIGPSKKHATLFWIAYGNSQPSRRSVMLYLKATVSGDESEDVAHYHATHPEFPHEATGDQVFDEAQWESYRKLGQHLAEPLFKDRDWLYSIPLQ